MKKLLLLLLLAAIGWGYYEGASESRTIQPRSHAQVVAAQEAPAPSAPASLLDSAKEAVHVVITGITSSLGPSGEAPAPDAAPAAKAQPAPAAPPASAAGSPVKEAPADPSLREQFNDVYEFKTALESRIDRSRFVPSDQIPKLLKEGVVAAEDRRFYEHGALDLMGVARAAVANYTAGRTVEGGSTISQQTVKNIFLSNERTMTRKVRELFLAVQLERQYTKEEILEIYLNTIYFGHGAYGIGEASRTYFHKEPKDLSLAECALLAGLPQAPSAYDPIEYPEEAAKRMTIVLMLMAREGYITPQEASSAAFDKLLK